MNWDQIYQDMAFMPFKSDFADYNKIRDALTTLYGYMQGQAKDYDIIEALGFLEQRFGSSVLKGCNLIRQALRLEDEISREQLVYEGITLIERYLVKNHSARIA
jgi:hypothetical protein